MTDEKNRGGKSARAHLDNILVMIKRLEHTQECDGGDECDLSDAEIFTGLGIVYKEEMKASADERRQYHNSDEIRQKISLDPLSVQVRSDWHEPGESLKPDEYFISLSTGGPACRITGSLDIHQQPDTAELQYQDWSTPWENFIGTTVEEDEVLLTYARQFYFRE